jgi:peptide/nickel transport system substrate-binding protein
MFPIGTGPWKILEWQVGSHILLVRNEKYREPGKPYLESIRKFQNSRKATSIFWRGGWMLQGSRRRHPGSAGWVGSSGSVQYGAVEANEMLVFNLADPKSCAGGCIRNPHPILSDVRVRQAIGCD